MSVIAPNGPTNPNSNQSTLDTDTNQGHNPAPIPGSVPGTKWVENAEDAKSSDKSQDVNPRPRSSEEADADARKVQQSQTPPAPAPSRATAPVVDPALGVPTPAPQRGNRT